VAPSGIVINVVSQQPPNEGAFFVRGGAGTAIPLFPRSRWAVSPGGDRIATLEVPIDVGESTYFYLKVLDRYGSETIDRRYPVTVEPIPDHVVDSVVATRSQMVSNLALRRAMLEDLKPLIPTYYSPAADLV
jgi:hypothetical protein